MHGNNNREALDLADIIITQSPSQPQARRKKPQQPKMVQSKQKNQFSGDDNQYVNSVQSQSVIQSLQNFLVTTSTHKNTESVASSTQKWSKGQSSTAQTNGGQHLQLNQTPQSFAFDIRQFQPMSPQIQSFVNAHLKEKAAELGNDRSKRKPGHTRTESKNQFGLGQCSLSLNSKADDNGIKQRNSIEMGERVDQKSTKDSILKNIVKQTGKQKIKEFEECQDRQRVAQSLQVIKSAAGDVQAHQIESREQFAIPNIDSWKNLDPDEYDQPNLDHDQDDSDYGDEEEMKEQVGDLPPKIDP